MELGSLILKYRKQNNLSQEDLATEIGVTRQTISKWELNETTPDLKQAIKLAELFKISINELIKDKKEDIQNEKSKSASKLILKIIKIAGITLGIIIFIICMGIILTTYTANYFSASPSGQGIFTYCDYNGKRTKYEVWKYYDTNQIFLTTSNAEISAKFKPYDYVSAEKMLNDIVEYIESNGGTCNIVIDE